MFRASTNAVVIDSITPLLFGLNSPVDHAPADNPGMRKSWNLKKCYIYIIIIL